MDISMLFKNPSAVQAWIEAYHPDSIAPTSASTSTSQHLCPSTFPPLPSNMQHPCPSFPSHIPSASILLPILDFQLHSRIQNGYIPFPVRDMTNGRNRPEMDDRARSQETDGLRRHLRDRMPYVQLAGGRSMAVVGERNDVVFELPGTAQVRRANASASASPVLRRVSGEVENEARLRGVSEEASNLSEHGSTESRIAVDENDSPGGSNSNSNLPKTPPKLMHLVDKVTGKGLREYLLHKGKEYGMRKLECQSIAFHDFTPKGATESFSNVLLAYYTAGKSERITVYEVNLPTMEIDQTTGEERQTTEPWIWFLISRPILSFESEDNSTSSGAFPLINSQENIHLPGAYSQNPIQTDLQCQPIAQSSKPIPPPNFPNPIPTSWVVFAAPLAHITSYPEIAVRPDHNPTQPYLNRRDYDLTHHGVPIFEFSSSSSETFSGASGIGFLSVEEMWSWDASDAYEPYSPNSLTRVRTKWYEKGWGEVLAPDDGLFVGRLGRNEVPLGTIWTSPSTHQGGWWERFNDGMWQDVKTWEGIRSAMAMGKCRVVVKFEEVVERDVEMLDGGALGVGLGIRYNNGVGRKSSRERLGIPRNPRLTRSVARKRSALGLECDGLTPATTEGGLRPRPLELTKGEKEKDKLKARKSGDDRQYEDMSLD